MGVFLGAGVFLMMRDRDSNWSQRFMKARVLAQGGVVIALVGAGLYGAYIATKSDDASNEQ